MTAHAKLSASSAERWLACPGSVLLSEGLTDETSQYAEWGTRCHELAEKMLKREPFKANDYELDMHKMAAQYRDYVLALGGLLHVEQRVDFSSWVPEGFGTADAIAIHPERNHVDVVDLKTGRGVRVDPEHNPQGMLYAAGVISMLEDLFDIDTVAIHIVQPPLDHTTSWEIRREDLVAWLEQTVAPRARQAFDGSSELTTGDHCRFCRAKPRCPQLEREMLAEFEETEPALLSAERIAELLPRMPLMIEWAKAVQDHALREALSGAVVPGYKIAQGRAVRKWRDEEEVATVLRGEGWSDAEIFERKLLGITAAERLLGKKHPVFELAQRGEGKPVLVPVSDPRPDHLLSDFQEIK